MKRIIIVNEGETEQEFCKDVLQPHFLRQDILIELINDGKTTAPSKRLQSLIIGYNKPVYGSILAEAIGLPKIRAKCPRFNDWITILEAV